MVGQSDLNIKGQRWALLDYITQALSLFTFWALLNYLIVNVDKFFCQAIVAVFHKENESKLHCPFLWLPLHNTAVWVTDSDLVFPGLPGPVVGEFCGGVAVAGGVKPDVGWSHDPDIRDVDPDAVRYLKIGCIQ